jgi:hypothetical protein
MDNNLVGMLPSSLGNLNKVVWINVKANKITGQAPAAIGLMENLEYLYLAGSPNMPPLTNKNPHHPGKTSPETNTFAGSILPPEWGNLSKLRHLELAQTEVSGGLPPEWSGMANIERLYLNGSRVESGFPGGNLTGPLPPEWSSMTKIFDIVLSDNPGLSGKLPPEWAAWVDIHVFRMSVHGIIGPIPSEWEAWANTIRFFSVRGAGGSTGRLTGAFPGWLLDDRSPHLHTLSMAFNNFTSIGAFDPPNITKSSIQVLDFYANTINAQFPEYSKNYWRTQIFDLSSGNSFSGEMPDDFFTNWDRLRNFSVAGQNIGGTLPTSFGTSSSTASTQRLSFNSAGFHR